MFEIAVIVLLVLGGGYVLWSWINGHGIDGGSTEHGSAGEISATPPESASSDASGGGGANGGGGGDG